jgi:CubicO group peptidase (beta-lactamase class C family)
MKRLQLKILYREFLFRIVDLELLAPQGDITRLLGQFAALLISVSLALTIGVLGIAAISGPPEERLLLVFAEQHFLISTTMLVVGLFAVLSWDSTFPDRRDVLVLGPLPVRARTIFLAKAAAVASALGIAVLTLNSLTGIAAPVAFASGPALAVPSYDPAIAPVGVAHMKAVLDRDLAFAFTEPDGAFFPGMHGGATIGILQHGERRIFAYGIGQVDSFYGIGSISKTFTGLILARAIQEGKVNLNEPIRDLLPPGTVSKPKGREITLLDLITHHSGLPPMPDNIPAAESRNPYSLYNEALLYAYISRHGVKRPPNPSFVYSNLGIALLGQALADRMGLTYTKLLQESVTGPLGLHNTWAPSVRGQPDRLIQSYGIRHEPLPLWDIGALAAAGSIRSNAADMLTYLDAQLHPERLPASLKPLADALVASHTILADAGPETSIGFAWIFDPRTGTFWHNGSIAGFTSYAAFNPKCDCATVVLYNSQTPPGFVNQLGEHVRQRFAGLPAVSLVSPVVSGDGGATRIVKSFFAYWLTMAAAAVFVFCGVLCVQGIAQLLPRQNFLRASSFLQMAFFVVLLTAYFLQPGFTGIESLTANQETVMWLPSYWFFGMLQQLNGHNGDTVAALGMLQRRAWIGLGVALLGAGGSYLICYFRTLRKIVEQPDILPSPTSLHWLPRFGGTLNTAVGQFALRTLLRSRRHRVMLSFYLGFALGLAIFLSHAPVLHEDHAAADVWYHVNAPLLVGSILMMSATVIGTRVVFSLPLELRANWIFRALPLPNLSTCLAAIRRSLYALAVVPMWLVLAATFFWLWPWRAAAGHTIVLALLGSLVAEVSLLGFHKIPFTCSYRPGKSRLNMTGLAAAGTMFVMSKAAEVERDAFDKPILLAIFAGGLLAAIAFVRWRTWSQMQVEDAPVQFEDLEPPTIQGLGLQKDGGWHMEVSHLGPS